jgi:peroxin-16
VKGEDKWARKANVILEALGNVQVLLEMASLRFGGGNKRLRWNLILAFEILKSLSRSLIFFINKEPLRIASEEEMKRDFLESSDVTSSKESNQDYSDLIELYRSSGRGKSRHGSFSAVINPEESDLKVVSEEDRFKKIIRFIGELVHIFRPVLYVLCILKFGYANWKSFLTSLSLDLFSLFCKSRDLSNAHTVQELKRRIYHLFYYLLRPPFFELFTK